MNSSIKKMSTLLSIMSLVILAFTFTGCSDDDEPVTEVTYTYGFSSMSASHPDFLEEMNKIENAFKSALGITGKPFTKTGSVEECDKQVYEACQKAFDLLKGEAWQGDYIFQVTNVGTGKVVCTATFSADNDNFIGGDLKNYRKYSADEVKPGDYIYSDGSISDGGLRARHPYGINVWAFTKPGPIAGKTVSGIVFWTPAESPSADRKTPASLTDDKIMTADFPDCTHGLAVSLRDISSEMEWQDPDNAFGYVKDFVYNKNFTHEKKKEFKSIASGQGATDNSNYILGYQNTQFLLAYNEYCLTKGKKGDIVRPVAALDEFSRNHPAPAGSTGWFIPSPKELQILCYMDVDNVWNQCSPEKISTRQLVNESLLDADGDILDNYIYWSSSEYIDRELNAICITFEDALLSYLLKPVSCHVRAVCAF